MTDLDPLFDQRDLIQSLLLALEKESSKPVLFLETHISWVLVADDVAYKFKKAVKFDFVDFTTLEARHFYCDEEIRLNRRLAPDLYLDVVPVTGRPEQPAIGGAGKPLEYGVKMRAFEQHAIWDYRLRNHVIQASEADQLAAKIARFHAGSPTAPTKSAWGTARVLQATADKLFAQIAALLDSPADQQGIADLRAREVIRREELGSAFTLRKEGGFIRECHGDLHAGNILTRNDRVEVFDCIEFNKSLRWIDVMNDLAFILMDLQFRDRHDLVARLLTRYLERSGDYAGLPVLNYYQTGRALVRCNVTLLRARQLRTDGQDAFDATRQSRDYLALAIAYSRPRKTAVMITHGFSGSGKSSLSEILLEMSGAIHLRSDIERKRMLGIAATTHPDAALAAEVYSSASTASTYDRLHVLARTIIESGFPVIIDAAFLKSEQRIRFMQLAQELDVPFFILDIRASEENLRTRVVAREEQGSDPSDAGLAVLTGQLAEHDPLSDTEMRHAIVIDTDDGLLPDAIRQACAAILASLQFDHAHCDNATSQT